MKRIVSVVLIAMLMSLAVMTFAGQQHGALFAGPQLVKATTTDWSATIGYSGPDVFCICVHTDWQHSDDVSVGLGMEAWYDFDLYVYYGQYGYLKGTWDFNAEVGYNYQNTWSLDGSPSCTYDINQYGYYSGTQFYGTNSPSYNSVGAWAYENYYPSSGQASFSPDASSINGQSYAAFWQNSNHNNIQYLSAGPTGSYYYIMTATQGPPTGYGGH